MRIPVRRLFTSESVTEGHPDKMADQINDGVLETVAIERIDKAVREIFDLRLTRPIHRLTAAYGRFGRTEPDFAWEPPTGPPIWPRRHNEFYCGGSR